MDDVAFLREAIRESERSVDSGGFPVGCIIVSSGEIVARGISNGKLIDDPTGHAEIGAIRSLAKQRGSRFLKDCTLYSSCEPCLMCFAACVWTRIPKIVFAVGKDRMPQNYFEGDCSLESINKKNWKKIDLVRMEQLADEALLVINAFERTL